MQFHTIRKKNKSRAQRRIGRGGKRGTYSGRGIKGLGARAGGKFRPQERDILKKIPKLRGHKFKAYRTRPAVVNIADLLRAFAAGDTISPDALLAKGLVRRVGGRVPRVKILGTGAAEKKFIFKDVLFSQTAAAKLNS